MISSWMFGGTRRYLANSMREGALPLRHAPQVGRVAERLGQRHFALDRGDGAVHLGRHDQAAAAGQVAHHRALELGRALRSRSSSPAPAAPASSSGTSRGWQSAGADLERHVRAVDLVVRAVLEDRPSARRPDSSAIGPLWIDIAEALLDRRDVLAWECARRRRSPRTGRSLRRRRAGTSSRPTMWAYWPEPPVCFLCRVLNSAALRGRLAVVHLRRADLDLDVVLAANPLDVDVQVQLAHAGDDRLARLLVGADAEASGLRGGSGAGPCSAGRRRRASAGVDGHLDDRLGARTCFPACSTCGSEA